MRIIGVDLHARQQTIAMLDTETGELVEKTFEHDGNEVRDFYSTLPGQALVGIEATGSMQWFLRLMEELGIECRVGHPQKIRKAETRKQRLSEGMVYVLVNGVPVIDQDKMTGALPGKVLRGPGYVP